MKWSLDNDCLITQSGVKCVWKTGSASQKDADQKQECDPLGTCDMTAHYPFEATYPIGYQHPENFFGEGYQQEQYLPLQSDDHNSGYLSNAASTPQSQIQPQYYPSTEDLQVSANGALYTDICTDCDRYENASHLVW